MYRMIKESNCIDACGVKIYGGVSIENNSAIFNFEEDSDNDIIKLCENSPITETLSCIPHIFGFSYTDIANRSQKEVFRKILKSVPTKYMDDVYDFVEAGMFNLDRLFPIENFSAIVNVESTNKSSISCIDLMKLQLEEFSGLSNTSFSLIKRICNEVKFDERMAYNALKKLNYSEERISKTIKIAKAKLESDGLFSMKRFLPPEIRKSFFDYLKFPDKITEDKYRSLQGVEVLIYDDLYTSGATLLEMSKYLHKINPNNRITAFALVKQH